MLAMCVCVFMRWVLCEFLVTCCLVVACSGVVCVYSVRDIFGHLVFVCVCVWCVCVSASVLCAWGVLWGF